MTNMSVLMKHACLWTQLKSRLQLVRTNKDANFNWLFLAGGPGLGSESLDPLIQLLHLPGNVWKLDLPGDGSNITDDDSHYFSNWSAALYEAASALSHVILVAHSTGGMYTLATPELKQILTGLVLMDSAPDASWLQHFMKMATENPLPGIEKLYNTYTENPDNDLLKKITVLSVPYCFTKAGLQKDLSFLESLPYNFRTCNWSARYFDNIYQAKWIPDNIPVLVFAGEEDRITPISLFMESTDFQRPNIVIRTIKQAAHFPWIENPQDVITVFQEYIERLSYNGK